MTDIWNDILLYKGQIFRLVSNKKHCFLFKEVLLCYKHQVLVLNQKKMLRLMMKIVCLNDNSVFLTRDQILFDPNIVKKHTYSMITQIGPLVL